jgi:hypothetical protein
MNESSSLEPKAGDLIPMQELMFLSLSKDFKEKESFRDWLKNTFSTQKLQKHLPPECMPFTREQVIRVLQENESEETGNPEVL